jgi:hypothetical protein
MKNKLFKIIGVVLIAGLVALFSTAYSTEVVELNAWNPVWELYHNHFGDNGSVGVHNEERRELIKEYETILLMDKILWNELEALRFDDPDLEGKKAILIEDRKRVSGAYKSIMKAITIFVKTHSGI